MVSPLPPPLSGVMAGVGGMEGLANRMKERVEGAVVGEQGRSREQELEYQRMLRERRDFLKSAQELSPDSELEVVVAEKVVVGRGKEVKRVEGGGRKNKEGLAGDMGVPVKGKEWELGGDKTMEGGLGGRSVEGGLVSNSQWQSQSQVTVSQRTETREEVRLTQQQYRYRRAEPVQLHSSCTV